MKMEWLEAFQLTAETKSLTKASEVLHMSQPALSKQIRSLEEELGGQLFMRSSVGVELTPSGEILLEASQKILNKVEKLKRDISLLQNGGAMDLVIGSWPSVATLYMPKRIAEHQQSGEQLNIQLRVFYSFYDLLTRIENGTMDAALFDDRGVKHDYYSFPVFNEGFLLFVNVNHPLYGGKESVTFEEIKEETFVMLPEGCDVRMLVDQAFSERGAQLKVALEIELGQSILGFIQANLGVAILPEIFVQQISANIKAIPITDFNLSRHIAAVVRDESVHKKLIAFFSRGEGLTER